MRKKTGDDLQKPTALVAVAQPGPADLLRIAVEKDLDIEKLRQLMDLQERWQKEQARIAFNQALAKFQSIVPEIPKTKNGYGYKYAPLAEIDRAIRSAMQECGLSKRWEMEAGERIKVTCIISHEMGYERSTSLDAAADSSGGKNAIQARGSAVTYLQRYTLIGALGLSTADEDNDGQEEPRTEPTKKTKEPQKEKSEPDEDRTAMREQWTALREELIQLGCADLRKRVAKIAGQIETFADIKTRDLPAILKMMASLRDELTAAKKEPPQSQEPDEEDVPLYSSQPEGIQRALVKLLEDELRPAGLYPTNREYLKRVAEIIHTPEEIKEGATVTDISQVHKNVVGKINNALSKELQAVRKKS